MRLVSPPIAARGLLDFIGRAETGYADIRGYRTIANHRERELGRPITELTLDELTSAQVEWRSKGWSAAAAGKYQFLRDTLLDLKQAAGLTGREIFDPRLQDKLAFALFQRAGWTAVADGEITDKAFALGLARAWAGLPVLADMEGYRRPVTRGQSFYLGVGENKARVDPESFEQILEVTLRRHAASAPARRLLRRLFGRRQRATA